MALPTQAQILSLQFSFQGQLWCTTTKAAALVGNLSLTQQGMPEPVFVGPSTGGQEPEPVVDPAAPARFFMLF